MSGVNLSLFKQLRILSNLHIHRCLGFLWLDVKEDKKKKHISVLNLSSLYPKTKSRTVLRYFSLYFISLSIFF